MRYEMDVDTYSAVGPYGALYDHENVAMITQKEDGPASLFVCLECGYTAHDRRLFLDMECERERNAINQTFAERFGPLEQEAEQ